MPCAATHLECHVHHHAHVLARVSTVGVAGRQVEKVGTCQVGDGLCSNGSSSGIVTFSIIRMFNRALLTNEGTCKCRQPGVRMQPYSIHFALRQQTETLPSGVYKADEIKPELTSQCFIAVYYKPKCIQRACCIDPKNYKYASRSFVPRSQVFRDRAPAFAVAAQGYQSGVFLTN